MECQAMSLFGSRRMVVRVPRKDGFVASKVGMPAVKLRSYSLHLRDALPPAEGPRLQNHAICRKDVDVIAIKDIRKVCLFEFSKNIAKK